MGEVPTGRPACTHLHVDRNSRELIYVQLKRTCTHKVATILLQFKG